MRKRFWFGWYEVEMDISQKEGRFRKCQAQKLRNNNIQTNRTNHMIVFYLYCTIVLS